MSISGGAYADLVAAAGARHPISAILASLADNVAIWAGLLTPGGQLVEAAKSVDGSHEARVELSDVVSLIPLPLAHTASVSAPSGLHFLAFPVGPGTKATGVLVVGLTDAPETEVFRLGNSAALLLRLVMRETRRAQTASRMVRDSVTRLIFAGRLDSAYELAAEMGLAAPPSRPHMICVRGIGSWNTEDLLDILEAVLPPDNRQLLAYSDDEECWIVLTSAQFPALTEALASIVQQNPSLTALFTEQIPIAKLAHRWHHWAADIRSAADGVVIDRSEYRGETASDWVHRLQNDLNPRVVSAVVSYLRHRGRWEAAAEELSIHRNTLRYRVAAAEKALHLDLSDPTASARLWLALRNEGLAD